MTPFRLSALVVATSLVAGFAGGAAWQWLGAPRAVPAGPAAAAPAPPAPTVAPPPPPPTPWRGEPRDGTVAPGANADFVLTVPPATCYLRVDLAADRDVDLFFAADQDALVHEDWSGASTTPDPDEWLVLARNAEPLLRHESLCVRVTNRSSRAADYQLRCVVVASPAVEALACDASVHGTMDASTGFRRTFVVNVPPATTAVRFDLAGCAQDLDLFVSPGHAALDVDDAPWRSATTIANDTLVITAQSEPPLAPGAPLFVTVTDPYLECVAMPFELFATASLEPPEPLRRALPALPRPVEPAPRAIAACVEVVCGDGGGSGVVVRSDGLVLTAAHVVAGVADRDIVVAVTLDTTDYATEMFRADVVARDEALDVALLRLATTLYGDPLPADLDLPVVAVAFDQRPAIGDPVSTLGYPAVGGGAARVTISWSRGTLVGFDPDPRGGLQLKTDALVSGGNSGGALLDSALRLVGITTSTIDENEGNSHLGYALPIERLPAAWRVRIGEVPERGGRR